MTFTKADVLEQKDLVDVLRYRREDLWNKVNESYTKYTDILEKELKETTKLRMMESNISN